MNRAPFWQTVQTVEVCDPHDVAQCCVHCWPRITLTNVRDDHDWPVCAAHARCNATPSMPWFVREDLH